MAWTYYALLMAIYWGMLTKRWLSWNVSANKELWFHFLPLSSQVGQDWSARNKLITMIVFKQDICYISWTINIARTSIRHLFVGLMKLFITIFFYTMLLSFWTLRLWITFIKTHFLGGKCQLIVGIMILKSKDLSYTTKCNIWQHCSSDVVTVMHV